MNAHEVKLIANGNWTAILRALCPQLQDALDNVGRHVPCPVHGGRDGFRVFRDANQAGGGICNSCGSFADGFSLLQWVNGWSFKESLDSVASFVGSDAAASAPRYTCIEQQGKQGKSKAKERAIAKAWLEAGSPTVTSHNPLTRYLIHRGLARVINDFPSDVRLHNKLAYWNADGEPTCIGRFPAMVSAVRSIEGEIVSLHRCYLTIAGDKADVPTVKKLMSSPVQGATNGAAVRLYRAGEVLAVTEGIETALAVRASTGLPVWAAISAGGLMRLQVPEFVKEVRIYADNDRSEAGQKAANCLADRLRSNGIRASILLPSVIGTDWLDVYSREEVA